ncbi:hypothetical protein SG35_031220 [Thalassomonas actiniarum]|uniref:Uncharacterized protein n=1 Tax=Thalassomonas actiniarum TaxID=485447 RepID=A0AAE9YXK5_9GAMM|nr:hypothetical protein SG35_031220 [Thalassomonas actiniarum]
MKTTTDNLPVTEDRPGYRREDQHLFDKLLAQETPVVTQVKNSPDEKVAQSRASVLSSSAVRETQAAVPIKVDNLQEGEVNRLTEHSVPPAGANLLTDNAAMANNAMNNAGNKAMEKSVLGRQSENMPLEAAGENADIASKRFSLETAFAEVVESNYSPRAVQADNNISASVNKETEGGLGGSQNRQSLQEKTELNIKINALPASDADQPLEPVKKRTVFQESSPMPVTPAPVIQDACVASAMNSTADKKIPVETRQVFLGEKMAAWESAVVTSQFPSLETAFETLVDSINTSRAVQADNNIPAPFEKRASDKVIVSDQSHAQNQQPLQAKVNINALAKGDADQAVAKSLPEASSGKTAAEVPGSREMQVVVGEKTAAKVTASDQGYVHQQQPLQAKTNINVLSLADTCLSTEAKVKSTASAGSSSTPVMNMPTANMVINKDGDKPVAQSLSGTSSDQTAAVGVQSRQEAQSTSVAAPSKNVSVSSVTNAVTSSAIASSSARHGDFASNANTADLENISGKAEEILPGVKTASREQVRVTTPVSSLSASFIATADNSDNTRVVRADNDMPASSDKAAAAEHKSEEGHLDPQSRKTQKQSYDLPAKAAVNVAGLAHSAGAEPPVRSSRGLEKTPRDEQSREESSLESEQESTTASAAVQQASPVRNTPVGEIILQNINSQENDVRNLQQVLVRTVEAMLTALPAGQERIQLQLQEDIFPGTSIVIERQNGAISIEIRTTQEQSFTLLEAHKELLVKQLEQLQGHETIEVELFNDDSGDEESKQQRDLYEEWLEELSQ